MIRSRDGQLVAGDPIRAAVGDCRAVRQEDGAGGVPMSYPPRPSARFPGFFLGDFLSPVAATDFASDPELFAELEQVVGPYRPWATAIHDGGNEAAVLADLHSFLEQHLKAIQFMMNQCDWDLFHFRSDGHRPLPARALARLGLDPPGGPGPRARTGGPAPQIDRFWQTLDRGIGVIEANLPRGAALLMISDHGFGPIEHYVNFNVWLLEQGYIALQDSLYVKQKHWFYRRAPRLSGSMA